MRRGSGSSSPRRADRSWRGRLFCVLAQVSCPARASDSRTVAVGRRVDGGEGVAWARSCKSQAISTTLVPDHEKRGTQAIFDASAPCADPLVLRRPRGAHGRDKGIRVVSVAPVPVFGAPVGSGSERSNIDPACADAPVRRNPLPARWSEKVRLGALQSYEQSEAPGRRREPR
jgi:hypothetical protein